MRSKLVVLLLVLCSLVLLREGIREMRHISSDFNRFAVEVEQNDMEPALLFYTESPHVRAAEQKIASSVNRR